MKKDQYLIDRVLIESSKRSRTEGEGFLDIKDCRLTKTGVFRYFGRELTNFPHLDPNESYYVYRSPEELFSPEALETFKMLIVTDEHPDDMVNITNVNNLSKGMSCSSPRASDIYLESDIRITDTILINKIENGVSEELSIGTRNTLLEVEGTTPEGEPYNFIQTNIRGNHVAVVPKGRAGSECKLHDSEPTKEPTIMKTYKLEEVMSNLKQNVVLKDTDTAEEDIKADLAYQLSWIEEEIVKLKKEKEDAIAKGLERIAELEAFNKKIEEEMAQSKSDLKDAEEKVEELSGVDTDALVEERLELLPKLAMISADYDPKGKSDAECIREVMIEAQPFLKEFSELTDDFFKGAFETELNRVGSLKDEDTDDEDKKEKSDLKDAEPMMPTTSKPKPKKQPFAFKTK